MLTFTRPYTLPLVVAGPCSAESRTQVVTVAQQIMQLPYVQFFRAGLWKPRTRGGQFEGFGEKGLPWLTEVAQTTPLKVITEVANPKHVELVSKAQLAGVWLGARTVANPFVVEELAQALKGRDLIIMVKNPINADLHLWAGAIERLMRHGITSTQLIAIHRGFSSFNPERELRFAPCWKIPFEFKRLFPDIPLISDPSHITGKSHLVASLSHKAIRLGLDGLMIEVHPTPAKALSDAKQQLTPEQLKKLISTLPWRCARDIGPQLYEQLHNLREQIDEIDQEILGLLAHRQKVVTEIALFKKEQKMTILQIKRFEEMLAQRLHWGQNLTLDQSMVTELFSLIHEASTSYQNDYLSNYQ